MKGRRIWRRTAAFLLAGSLMTGVSSAVPGVFLTGADMTIIANA